jgi:hypothetical protein
MSVSQIIVVPFVRRLIVARPAMRWVVGASSAAARSLTLSHEGAHWRMAITGLSVAGHPLIDWLPVGAPSGSDPTDLVLQHGGVSWRMVIAGVTLGGHPTIDWEVVPSGPPLGAATSMILSYAGWDWSLAISGSTPSGAPQVDWVRL